MEKKIVKRKFKIKRYVKINNKYQQIKITTIKINIINHIINNNIHKINKINKTNKTKPTFNNKTNHNNIIHKQTKYLNILINISLHISAHNIFHLALFSATILAHVINKSNVL